MLAVDHFFPSRNTALQSAQAKNPSPASIRRFWHALFWRLQYGLPAPSSLHRQKSLSPFKEKISPLLDLIGKYLELLGQLYKRLLTSQDGKETFALKAGL